MFSSPENFQTRAVDDVWYIGVVIDNNDPEKIQRIKVRSHDLHRGIPDEALPWAIKCSGPGQGNSDKGVGTISVPVIGSKVLIKNQNDSQYYPMYMAIPNTEDLKIQELVETDYPHVYAKIDRSGNLFWFNTKQDHMLIEHVSGTSFFVDGAGRVKIEVADSKVGPDATSPNQRGVDIDIIGTTDIKVSGDSKVHTQGNTEVFTGSDTDIHTGGQTNIYSGGETQVHSNNHVDVAAPTIDLNTNSPDSPSSPDSPETPKSRSRPEEDTIKNKKEY